MLVSGQMMGMLESMNRYGNELFELTKKVENGTEKPDPMEIGKKILELLGFSVKIAGVGYDSVEVTVKKSGKGGEEEVFHQFYGR